MLTYFSIKRFTLGHHHTWQVCVRARFWMWNSYPLNVHFQRNLNSVEPIFKTYCRNTGWHEKIWWRVSLNARSEASCNTSVLSCSPQTCRDEAFPRDAPWLLAEKSLALGAVKASICPSWAALGWLPGAASYLPFNCRAKQLMLNQENSWAKTNCRKLFSLPLRMRGRELLHPNSFGAGTVGKLSNLGVIVLEEL